MGLLGSLNAFVHANIFTKLLAMQYYVSDVILMLTFFRIVVRQRGHIL